MQDSTLKASPSELPKSFTVAVIMQKKPTTLSQWVDHVWESVGIAVIEKQQEFPGDAQLIHEDQGTEQYLYSGYPVTLHIDECESYYHNLMSENPRCYVIARKDENEIPIPFLVSMSFDEAHAYLEGDEDVFDVDVPPEIYRWTEAYLIDNYVSEKRKKRKRDDWKDK